MDSKLLKYYTEFGMFTNPGIYLLQLKNDLPHNVQDIGLLLRKQIIHPVTLKHGNTGSNADLKYGDMTKVPWYRKNEDDFLVTASAMLAELYRRDERGFINDRTEENRLILSCRYVSILMASILKSKQIPCRLRSGFVPYFDKTKKTASDHWINQYWNETENKWITIDVDASIEDYLEFDPFNIPDNIFLYPAESWFAVRSGKYHRIISIMEGVLAV